MIRKRKTLSEPPVSACRSENPQTGYGAGLITLFIPEFKKIRNLAQFTYYHSETVDLHSLKTLETLHHIARGMYGDRWPMFKQVYDELKNPEWLFLVGLLHDVGKGYRGEHPVRGAEIVARILKRLGLSEKAARVIPFSSSTTFSW